MGDRRSVADSRGELIADRGRSAVLHVPDLRPVYPVHGGRIVLMFKFARLGQQPENGRYHFEQSAVSFSAGTLNRSRQMIDYEVLRFIWCWLLVGIC